MHHAIADGILMTAILEDHHSYLWPPSKDSKQSPTDSTQSHPVKDSTKRKKSSKPTISQVLYHLPWSLYDYFIRFLLFGTIPMTPLSINNKYNKNTQLSHACNLCVSHTLPLGELKRLAKRYNGTINDLTAALFCSALNQFFKQTMDRSDYLKLIGNSDDPFYLRFVTVFNIRLLGNKKLDKFIEQAQIGVDGDDDDNDSNAVALVPIPMPCGEMDFSNRITLIQSIFNHFKYGSTPIASVYAIKLLNMVGGPDLVVKFFNFQYAKCFATWSNFAGPKKLLPYKSSIDGSVVDDIDHCLNTFSLTNTTGVGFECTVMSYVDEITFSLVVDDNIMNEEQLNRLVDILNSEFLTLSGLLPLNEE